jgi:Na+-driven multidrug efflux pump
MTGAWGLPGFAASLGLSRALGLALHLWLWRVRLNIWLVASDAWRLPREPIFAILRIGLPGAAENVAYRLAFMTSVVVAGRLGETALATQAYVLQLQHGILLFGLATGLAVEIVVGHLVGAGAFAQAHRLVRNALAAGIAVSLCLAVLVALFGAQLLGVFSSDAKLVATGVTLLWWAVLLEPGRTFNLVVINALRATGDARYPVVAGAASMLVILAGGSWWLGIHLGWGLTGVWIAYAVDEWVRGLLMWARWAGHGWVPFARNSRRQLRARSLIAQLFG